MARKALVCVKSVVDPNVKIRVKADGTGIELDNVKMAMNPFCEIALEEAIRLREKGELQEVVVLSIGPARAQDTLRTALALGADRAIHIAAPAELEPLAVAKLARAVATEEDVSLVLLGKQAIDDESNQTGQMLAALLGWGQGTFASSVELGGDAVKVTREVDSGLETIEIDLPAIITVDLRLNTPRYASLPNIMKAKRKPLVERSVEEFGIDVAARLEVLRVEPPPPRKAGVQVETVDALVQSLRAAGAI